MASAMDVLSTIYADRTAPTRDWKAAGGRAVGYFCDNFPVELVEAAGFLPVRISGDPNYDRRIERRYITPLIPKAFAGVRQAGLEFVNAMCARIIGGVYDDLDFLVISASRKPVLNIYPQLLAAKEARPELRLPDLHVMDHAHVPSPSARAFNARSLLALKTRLEVWSGRIVEDDALAGAVADGNEGRDLVRKVNALRTAPSPRLSGVRFLEAVGAGMVMERRRHNTLLRRLLESPPEETRSGLRVFVGGSPTDNLQLYRAIESHGVTVVAEDHCWGERCGDLPISTGDGAFAGLVARWQDAPPCGLRFPLDASPDNCVARAKRSRADCAILSVYRGDELQVWDTPQEVAALRSADVPTLHLKEQPYAVDPDALADEIGRFLQVVRNRAGGRS